MLKLKSIHPTLITALIVFTAVILGLNYQSRASALAPTAAVSNITPQSVDISISADETDTETLKGTLFQSIPDSGVFSATLTKELQRTSSQCQLSIQYSSANSIASITKASPGCSGIFAEGDLQTTVEGHVLDSTTPVDNSSATTTGTEDRKTRVCNAGLNLSWLVCALIDNLIGINAFASDLVNSMLAFSPRMLNNQSGTSAIYLYWQQFRNIANLSLLFGFMAIIFSQATSIGLSVYGIKKLLPRIIAFAIVINLSFFMCQILVDISNILGSGAMQVAVAMEGNVNNDINQKEILDEVWGRAWELSTQAASDGSNGEGGAGSSTPIGEVLLGAAKGAVNGAVCVMNDGLFKCAAGAVGRNVTAMVVGGVGLTAIAAMLLPIMIIAFFAIIITLAILIVRQIIIIAMIVISPIAIAAAILPGTQPFYNFWKKTFSSMLLMFPIIAMIFAGARLMAMLFVEGSVFVLPSVLQGSMLEAIQILIIIIILVSPYMFTPFVVKASGGMVEKLTSVISKATTKATTKGTKAGISLADKGRSLVEKRAVSRMKPIDTSTFRGRTKHAARMALNRRYRSAMLGDYGKRVDEKEAVAMRRIIAESRTRSKDSSTRARGQLEFDKLEQEDAKVRIMAEFGNDPKAALERALNTKDLNLAKIASEQLVDKGDIEGFMKTLGSSESNFLGEDMQKLSSHMLQNKGDALKKDLAAYSALKDNAAGSDSVTTNAAGQQIRGSLGSTGVSDRYSDKGFLAETIKNSSPEAVVSQNGNAWRRSIEVMDQKDATNILNNITVRSKLSPVELDRLEQRFGVSPPAGQRARLRNRSRIRP